MLRWPASAPRRDRTPGSSAPASAAMPWGACAKPLVSRSVSRSRPTTPDCPLKSGASGEAGARFRMHQECRAPVGFGAHQFHAALGLVPSADHDVFQLFVQKFLARLFPCRVGDFDEIRQHARRLETLDLTALDAEEQPLHRFGGVGAMRKNLFERILARLLPRQNAARFLPASAASRRLARLPLLRSPLRRGAAGRPAIPAPSAAPPAWPTIPP